MNCSCLRLHDDQPDCCGNCRFFACFGCTYPRAGKCQRHAPAAGERDFMGAKALFPEVERATWCGDYERRPPAVEP